MEKHTISVDDWIKLRDQVLIELYGSRVLSDFTIPDQIYSNVCSVIGVSNEEKSSRMSLQGNVFDIDVVDVKRFMIARLKYEF